MKKNLQVRKSLILIAVLIIPFIASAQFEITAEIRPRTEYRHGYRFLADSAMQHALFTDQRSRINLDYQSEKYQVYLSMQDIRTWGSESQLVVADGLTSLHQAWAKINFNEHWSAKLGRQEIIYNDHRIFGNVGWAQQGRSHDAAIIGFRNTGMILDLGFAFNQNRPQLSGTSYSVSGSYKSFQFAWLRLKQPKFVNPSFLILSKGDQVDYKDINGEDAFHDNYSLTIGNHTKWKTNKKLTGSVSAYYQLGSTAHKPARDINAFLVGTEINIPISNKVTTSVGGEMQSGNDLVDLANGEQRAFNPFFGTNHKFNGHMDYFYVGNHIGHVGLIDGYAKLKYKKGKIQVGGDLHYFSAQGDLSSFDQYLGTEIDLHLKLNLAERANLGIGYSQMFGSESLALINDVFDSNGNLYTEATSNWAYVMFSFTPTLLTVENKK